MTGKPATLSRPAALPRERGESESRALVDPVTRLWNQDSILGILDRELARIRREVGVVSVVRAEVDFYRRILDEWGPEAGHPVLRYVARHFRGWVRTYDAVGRYGESGFLAVLPGCGRADATIKAETIRRIVAAVPVPVAEGRQVRVTLSTGVAEGRTDSREVVLAAAEALRRVRKANPSRA